MEEKKRAPRKKTAKKRDVQANGLTGPYYPTDESDIWRKLFGRSYNVTTSTNNTIDVNESSALSCSAWWRAINLISATISLVGTDAVLTRHMADGEEREVPTEPRFDLLRRKPNTYTTGHHFFKKVQADALKTGNGYAAIVWRNGGELDSLWQLRPDLVRMKYAKETVYYPANDTTILAGTMFYEYSGANGTEAIPYEDMLHIKGYSEDGFTGLSPTRVHMNSIGLALAADQYGHHFYLNGAMPSGVLTHPTNPSPAARKNIMDGWEERARLRKVALLEEGIGFQALGQTSQESQYIETVQNQVSVVSRIFGIPPHMLGDLKQSTFSNMEQLSIEFRTYCIADWAKAWCSEINTKLYTSNQYEIEFDLDILLQTDKLSRTQANCLLVNTGVITKNEAREDDGREPMDGGDELMQPANLMPAKNTGVSDGQTNRPEQQPVPDNTQREVKTKWTPEDDKDARALAFVPVAYEALRRLSTKELNHLRKIAGKPQYRELADEFYATHRDTLYSAIQPVCLGLASLLGHDLETDAVLRGVCEEIATRALMEAVSDPEGTIANKVPQLQARAEELVKSLASKMR